MKKIREKLEKFPAKIPAIRGGFNPGSAGGESYRTREDTNARPDPAPLYMSRAPVKTSGAYLKKAGVIYSALLASTFLDLFAFKYLPQNDAARLSEVSLAGAAFCILIALTDFWKPLLLQLGSGVKQQRRRFFDLQGKYTWILYVVLTLAFAGSVLSKLNVETFSFELLVQGFFALVVAGVSAWTIVKQLLRSRSEQLARESDLAERIEQANQVHFGTVVAEMVAARLVCPLLAVTVFGTGQIPDGDILGVVSMVGSVLLLGSQSPGLSKFQAPCKRCRKLTSIAALSGLCIDCFVKELQNKNSRKS